MLVHLIGCTLPCAILITKSGHQISIEEKILLIKLEISWTLESHWSEMISQFVFCWGVFILHFLRTQTYIFIPNYFFHLHLSTFSLGYQISYRLHSRDSLRWSVVEVGSNARQFTVTGLSSEHTYVFRLIARTAVGWGQQQEALVVTTERRGKQRLLLLKAGSMSTLIY